MNAPRHQVRVECSPPHLPVPRRRLRLQDRAGGAGADHRQDTRRLSCPRSCWSASKPATMRLCTRSTRSQAIVATTDFFMPIVDDPFDFGAIAATNAISDVYAMGGTPLFALALVGMPINTLPIETIRRILEGGESVCARAGIPVAGGHSIDSVEPIYGLVAIGLVHPKHVKRNADARAGDKLVLGKPLGVGIYSAALKKEQLRRRPLQGA